MGYLTLFAKSLLDQLQIWIPIYRHKIKLPAITHHRCSRVGSRMVVPKWQVALMPLRTSNMGKLIMQVKLSSQQVLRSQNSKASRRILEEASLRRAHNRCSASRGK